MSSIDVDETIRRLTATCLAQGLIVDFLLGNLLSHLGPRQREIVALTLRQKSLQIDHLRSSADTETVAEVTSDVTVKMQQELSEILERALQGAAAVRVLTTPIDS